MGWTKQENCGKQYGKVMVPVSRNRFSILYPSVFVIMTMVMVISARNFFFHSLSKCFRDSSDDGLGEFFSMLYPGVFVIRVIVVVCRDRFTYSIPVHSVLPGVAVASLPTASTVKPADSRKVAG